MARADLSRTAFYRHFDERGDLLLALLDESGVGDDPAGAVWKDLDDPIAAVRRGCELLTDLFVRHGRLLRASAEAAVSDTPVAQVYGTFAESLVATTAERIEADRQAGRSHVQNVREVARALVWMNERYLMECFGRRPFTADPKSAAAALSEIWTAAIYRA